jgi:RNA recognition motif-containing protein
VSALRLSIRNLKKSVSDVELRTLCTGATIKGLKRNRATKTDLERLLAADAVPATENALKLPNFGKGGKRQMPSCKVMLDLERVRAGVPQSRGYGFVEFNNHVHALACLRELNQNTAYSSSASGAGIKEAKEDKRSTLIVEFSLENMRKVKILQDRVASRKAASNEPADEANKTKTTNKRKLDDAQETDDIKASGHASYGNNEKSDVDDDYDAGSDGADDDDDMDVTDGAPKVRTQAAKRRIADQRRREKQNRRLQKKNEILASGGELPIAPEKTKKKRGGLFSRIREKRKAKSGTSETE